MDSPFGYNLPRIYDHDLKRTRPLNNDEARLFMILILFGIAILAAIPTSIILFNNYRYRGIDVEASQRFWPNSSEPNPFLPRQLHLSLGQNDEELYVTWSTIDPVFESTLIYMKTGWLKFSKSVQGTLSTTEIRADEPSNRTTKSNSKAHYTYRAKMAGLDGGSVYTYRVKTTAFSPYANEEQVFYGALNKVSNPDLSRRITIAMESDIGSREGRLTGSIVKSVYAEEFNFIIHNGGFASGLDNDAGKNAIRFMEMVEPITARVPLQVSSGSIKNKQDYTLYDSKFTMINGGKVDQGKRNNFFYSFDAGPVHFVAISTDFYKALDSVGLEAEAKIKQQFRWLREDLRYASCPGEREKRPWIVVYGHQPMYCSIADQRGGCTERDSPLRVGLHANGTYALEGLFYEMGVDVQFYAQQTHYERFLPLYNHQVLNGTDAAADPYLNPRAPVHIVGNTAGQYGNESLSVSEPAVGSVKQVSSAGYTILSASRCKLEFKHVSHSPDEQVLDEFTITKTRLTSFPEESQQSVDCTPSFLSYLQDIFYWIL